MSPLQLAALFFVGLPIWLMQRARCAVVGHAYVYEEWWLCDRCGSPTP